MRFIESVFQKLKANPKRVVFPEGAEPRVLRAASRYARLQLGAAVLLGKKKELEAVAVAEKASLDHVAIIDPAESPDLPVFVERLEKLKRYRDLGAKAATEIMTDPNFFAAMMVQYGQVDAVVTGARATAASSLRPLIQLVSPSLDANCVSSCMALDLSNKRYGEKGVMFFADCAVIPDPTTEQLATIALQTGQICRQLTGNKPRIAMLSFSTKGSSRLPQAEKIRAATALARQRIDAQHLEMEIDGEMQVDAALLPDLAERKAPQSLVAGRANVLIFPDLNSGNIGVKLVQFLAGAETYGQILLGLSKPCADLSRGATEEDILGVAALMGLQAIEFHRIFPAAPLA